ncbi:MAG TPA: LysR family transcriptional regulator [Pseudomonadales bacterium]|nr:LysR family transcriptional regulator [Gammaproteobacteria bacterium]MDP6025164.1 LysR family transcriptional regulator [Pseudomonadales bacterium]MDP6314777.1 LysR family transcriptional regulator [Pseudomonadales bacterium]HJP50571.1 LysR family transcriptional regulator [Pseudomonadales bacterium]
MDLDGIKAFTTVAETSSFSLAANRLHLTQPAVSKRIALLESQMGVRLFDRIGRTVTLTEAGRALEPRALEILLSIEDTQRVISNLAGDVGGQLSLATSHHIGLWHLPQVLRAFSAQHPKVALDLHFMDSEVAYEQIVQGNLELGIITLAPTSHERLASIPIWRDELVFVCSADQPLAQNNKIYLEQLPEYPVILPDMTTFTGRIVKELFTERGLTLNVSMSTNYLETIKMLISVGLGWSVLPKSMLDDSIQVIDVPNITIERRLGIIHHVQRTLSNAATAFLDLVKSQSQYSESTD